VSHRQEGGYATHLGPEERGGIEPAVDIGFLLEDGQWAFSRRKNTAETSELSGLHSRDGFVCGGDLTLRFEVGYLPLWLLLKMEAPSVQAKERLGYIVNQI
jgi:hypothetical protein